MPRWLFMTVGMTVFVLLYAGLRILITADARKQALKERRDVEKKGEEERTGDMRGPQNAKQVHQGTDKPSPRQSP